MFFKPTWLTVFLFEPDAIASFNWGEQLYSPAKELWDITHPNTPQMLQQAIERVALPLLRPVTTIDDFVAFTNKDRFPHTHLDLYPLRKVYVDAARGDVDAVRDIASIC